jgi:hypothetical protein
VTQEVCLRVLKKASLFTLLFVVCLFLFFIYFDLGAEFFFNVSVSRFDCQGKISGVFFKGFLKVFSVFIISVFHS